MRSLVKSKYHAVELYSFICWRKEKFRVLSRFFGLKAIRADEIAEDVEFILKAPPHVQVRTVLSLQILRYMMLFLQTNDSR